MTRRRALRFAAVLMGAAALSVAAAPVQAAPITSYPLPRRHLFPEGFGWDASTGNVFVGGLTTAGGRFNVNDAASASVFSAGGSDGRTQTLGVRANHGTGVRRRRRLGQGVDLRRGHGRAEASCGTAAPTACSTTSPSCPTARHS